MIGKGRDPVYESEKPRDITGGEIITVNETEARCSRG